MKIYISGPVPANRGCYRHPYLLAEARLKLLGHSPFNPCWMNFNDGWNNDDILSICLTALSVSEAIFMLEGWEDSKNAQAEYDYAVKNGKKIFYAGNENDIKKLRKLEVV
jgi:hypothetical protein